MKALFGGVIAVILLALYGYTIAHAICEAMQSSGKPVELGAGYASTMSAIGGLVSALVITELAIAKPGQAPALRLLGDAPPPAAARIATIISIAYVLVWLVLGLCAFVVGTLKYPGSVQSLTDFGQAWLGLAIAAGYSYFGIAPPTSGTGAR